MLQFTIANQLISWYFINKRDLPWRNTRDPFLIWVSEIILQQTRVVQGTSYFYNITNRFPNIKELAESDESELLRLWQGLGYYSRARNMHKAAKQIMDEFEGVFPSQFDTLLSLKGVGSYTAAAIASFAFNEPVPVVDGNVFRVLARLYAINLDISSSKAKKYFFDLAKELISIDDPASFNQAIMEFGALYCVPKNPDCQSCIFKHKCMAFNKKRAVNLRVKSKKLKIKKRYFNYFVIEN